MVNATGISRWTNASRNHATHIFNDGRMLCGKHFFSQNEYPLNLANVTCEKCKKKYNQLTLT